MFMNLQHKWNCVFYQTCCKLDDYIIIITCNMYNILYTCHCNGLSCIEDNNNNNVMIACVCIDTIIILYSINTHIKLILIMVTYNLLWAILSDFVYHISVYNGYQ